MNIRIAVGSLLEKLNLDESEKESVMALTEVPNPEHTDLDEPSLRKGKWAINKRPAMSQQPTNNRWGPPEHVFFRKTPREGLVRHVVRKKDNKVRMVMIRVGFKRLWSNWHTTKQEAFEFLQKMWGLEVHRGGLQCTYEPACKRCARGCNCTSNLWHVPRWGRNIAVL